MQVWELGPGRLMVAGGFSDLSVHHHPAVQITVGGRGPLTVTSDGDAHDVCRLVVIASGARHAVRSDPESGALTLYLGLQTPLGVTLNALARQGVWVVDDGQAAPDRIAVGGDSAGGNLAAVTAQQAVRLGGVAPSFQLLMYPATDLSTRRPSRDLFARGSTFTDRNLGWVMANYIPAGTDLKDPRLSPQHGDVAGLPPAYIATAGFDPVRDDGEAYADKLRAAGIPVALVRQADLPHGYLNFVGLGGRFVEAAAEAAGALRLGLAAASGSPAQGRAGEFVGVGDIP
jgi:acetyl esterase/lipase